MDTFYVLCNEDGDFWNGEEFRYDFYDAERVGSVDGFDDVLERLVEEGEVYTDVVRITWEAVK